MSYILLARLYGVCCVLFVVYCVLCVVCSACCVVRGVVYCVLCCVVVLNRVVLCHATPCWLVLFYIVSSCQI